MTMNALMVNPSILLPQLHLVVIVCFKNIKRGAICGEILGSPGDRSPTGTREEYRPAEVKTTAFTYCIAFASFMLWIR